MTIQRTVTLVAKSESLDEETGKARYNLTFKEPDPAPAPASEDPAPQPEPAEGRAIAREVGDCHYVEVTASEYASKSLGGTYQLTVY